MFYLVIVAVILCILFKILNVNNSAEKSIFYCKNQKFLEEFLKRAPELELPYVPTRFWGFSGHIQTIIQGLSAVLYSLDPEQNKLLEVLLSITIDFYLTKGVISRLHCPLVNGHRVSLKLTDGATVTYDLYHAIEQHPEHGDFTLAICPGIGNNSESVYIRRVVYNAQLHGYRVCVLNHIGTLATVPVTSPRIFMYGNTADYAAMIKDLVRRFPTTKVISVGFSMGGNLITKYLGEPRVKPKNVVAGLSVCQGYDAKKAMELLLEWKGFRRLYIYAMTENMKSIIRRWHNALFTEEIKKKLGITERQVYSSATLLELDDIYTRRLAGFTNLPDFYNAMSCKHHLHNIKVPTVFINSLDDPIVPPPLLENIRDAALKNPNMIFIEQKFGGHLGFYEGGFFYSNPLTWQDRMVIHIAHALVADEGGKPGFEEVKEEEEEEHCTSPGFDVAVHRVESSSEGDEVTSSGKKGLTAPVLNLDCFHTGISSDETSTSDSGQSSPVQQLTPNNSPLLTRRAGGLNIFPQ